MLTIVYVAVGIAAAVGIAVSFLCIWFYRIGVKDGQAAKNGATPERIIPSLKERKEQKEAKEQQKEQEDEFSRIVNYDPFDHDFSKMRKRNG